MEGKKSRDSNIKQHRTRCLYHHLRPSFHNFRRVVGHERSFLACCASLPDVSGDVTCLGSTHCAVGAVKKLTDVMG